MKLINFAIKSAFVTGALTAGPSNRAQLEC
ncbi:MAG: hypothetical protein CM15mP40_11000 [Alphaproteobacteria bacterium]|nr:MAG: hypothetical protein CM15mP40_11000 [Alphaproteobacteria bacterium]